MSCGVGRRPGSNLALLWLWRRPVTTAPIRPLAWEPPYAASAALKRQKDEEKERKRNTEREPGAPAEWPQGGAAPGAARPAGLRAPGAGSAPPAEPRGLGEQGRRRRVEPARVPWLCLPAAPELLGLAVECGGGRPGKQADSWKRPKNNTEEEGEKKIPPSSTTGRPGPGT